MSLLGREFVWSNGPRSFQLQWRQEIILRITVRQESPSRNSARTQDREGRCLRSPCRSRLCTRDRQLGFWGASTRLPNSIAAVHLLPGGLLVLSVAVFSFPVIGSSSSPSSLLHGDRGRTKFQKSECASLRSSLSFTSFCFCLFQQLCRAGSIVVSYLFQQVCLVVSEDICCLFLLCLSSAYMPLFYSSVVSLVSIFLFQYIYLSVSIVISCLVLLHKII